MAKSASEWEVDLQRASNLAQDISYMLAERDSLKRAGSTSADTSFKARAQLATLDKSISALEKQFRDVEANPATFRLTARDVASRREGLKKLQVKRNELRNAEKSLPGSSDRDALLGGGAGKTYGRETELTRDLTTQDMMQRTDKEMKKQDDIMDDMSRNLDNLKHVGVAIRDEATLHNALLDDMEKEVDKGVRNLNRETRRVEHFTRDAKTCWMYVTICILLAILLALILVRWH